MDSILKRILVGVVILLALWGLFGLAAYVLRLFEDPAPAAARIFALAALSLPVILAIWTIFSERARRLLGGAAMFLFGIPLTFLGIADFISYHVGGPSVLSYWQEYTLLSQLLIVFATLCFGGYFLYEGVRQIKRGLAT
jgi:hypothetical protein